MLNKIKIFAFLFALWFWLYAAPAILSFIVPGEFFLDAKSLYIPDYQVGETPYIEVDREIHHNFIGEWSSTVWEISPNGPVRVTNCRPNSRGVFPYTTNSQLPDPLSLDWWFEVPPNKSCQLPPGQYEVETTWTIRANWLPLVTLNESVRSNTFIVYDRSARGGGAEPRKERSDFCGQESK